MNRICCRIHDTRFDTEFVSRGCQNKHLVSHKQSVEEIKSKMYSIINTGKLCEKEEKTRDAFIYNWKQPPSKCCVRSPLAWVGDKVDLFESEQTLLYASCYVFEPSCVPNHRQKVCKYEAKTLETLMYSLKQPPSKCCVCNRLTWTGEKVNLLKWKNFTLH